MRVLFDHSLPFQLAHGGVQIQIQQTQAALRKIGVEVEFLRWWEETQPGDLIHYFGVPNGSYRALAKQKNIPIVATTLFSETCNRPSWRLRLQGLIVQTLLAIPVGGSIKGQLTWPAFRQVACTCVGLRAERQVLETVYRVPSEQIREVPLGVDDVFLNEPRSSERAGPLICVGTITAQKNSIPLANLAREARVPVRFVGRPYAEDAYWREFQSLVDGKFVLYESFMDDTQSMCCMLDHSSGALVVSEYENWSLAAHEAVARGLPLLLRRLPWATERFGTEAQYFDTWKTPQAAATLRSFYEAAPHLPSPAINVPSWKDVAQKLKDVYDEVLRRHHL